MGFHTSQVVQDFSHQQYCVTFHIASNTEVNPFHALRFSCAKFRKIQLASILRKLFSRGGRVNW